MNGGSVVDVVEATATSRPEYGNWVSTRFVMLPALAAVVLAILALAADVLGIAWLFGVLLGLAALAVLVTAYFAYARHLLGARGGSVQERVQELVLERLPWDGQGRALDIGCGNGPLTIALACRFPEAEVTGIDFWGESWEYSQDVCETNAAGQGVAERVSFRRASAAALPFADASFEAAVSNLCFHEVRGVRDKREVVKEAFACSSPAAPSRFRTCSASRAPTARSTTCWRRSAAGEWRGRVPRHRQRRVHPGALRLPFMVGSMGMIYGTK